MKLRQLQCLCAVVDAGFNISRASAVLHATQPAVGKQLRQLEDELGTDLLLRQGGRIIGLSAAGERILIWARRTLQCTDNIRSAAAESDDEAGASIELATSHTHAKYVLLPAILAFKRGGSRVRIVLQQGTPEQVAELVHEGKVAFGVIHQPPVLPKQVVAVPFLTARQMLVTPVGHPLQKEKQLTLAKLAAYPMIAQNPERPQGSRVLREFQQAGIAVDLTVQALNADVMKSYVAAGLGIAIIPSYAYSPKTDPGLRVRNVDHLFAPGMSTVLLRRGSYLQHHVYAFLEQLDASLSRARIETLIFEEG